VWSKIVDEIFWCDLCGASIAGKLWKGAVPVKGQLFCEYCSKKLKKPQESIIHTKAWSSGKSHSFPWIISTVSFFCLAAIALFIVMVVINNSVGSEKSTEQVLVKQEAQEPVWSEPNRIQEIIGIEAPSGFDVYVCLTDGRDFTASSGTMTVSIDNRSVNLSYRDSTFFLGYNPKKIEVSVEDFDQYTMTSGMTSRSVLAVRAFISDVEDLESWFQPINNYGELYCHVEFSVGGKVLSGTDKVVFRRKHVPQ